MYQSEEWKKNVGMPKQIRIEIFCQICGKKILVTENEKKVRKYCNRKCMYQSEERKNKIGKANKNKIVSKATKKKQSKSHIGIFLTEKHKRKISEANKGRISGMKNKCHSNEAKLKMRLSRIKDIENKNGIARPNYNQHACNWFKFFDKVNNTKGQYATNGGEYFIKELGYWPDYINFSMKLIMEWDEKYHDRQIEKDITRQKEIMEYFPDFEFIRIKME